MVAGALIPIGPHLARLLPEAPAQCGNEAVIVTAAGLMTYGGSLTDYVPVCRIRQRSAAPACPCIAAHADAARHLCAKLTNVLP